MSQSPVKRRKISPTASVPGDAPETGTEAPLNEVPGFSHRISFQSPTRSSLARSNPEVLSNVLRRSPIRSPSRPTSSGRDREGGEAFGLRDRKALRPSLTGVAPGSPSKAPQLSREFPKFSPERRSSAFTAPPRRVSRRPVLLDTPTTTPLNVPEAPTLTPVPANNPDEQLANELDSATRDSELPSNPTMAALQDEEGEPDLPPTPTQLGLEKPPGRPKGLLSSPSRQYEARRYLRKETAVFNPLRRASRNTSPERQASPEVVSEEVRKKEVLREELAQQLNSLRDDVTQLEDWARLGDGAEEGPALNVAAVRRLLKILSSSDPTSAKPLKSSKPLVSSLLSTLLPFSQHVEVEPAREASPLPTNPYSLALEDLSNPLPYLTVFASVNLQSYSTKMSTTTQSDESQPLLETHNITLSAPSPFSHRLFKVPLRFETDLISQSVASVSISQSESRARIPPDLRTWMENRLSNPLLKTDISSLCWGVGRYWDACVSRAQIWTHLQRRYSRLLTSSKTSKSLDRHLRRLETEQESNHERGIGIGRSQIRLITPNLERKSLLFSSPSSASVSTKPQHRTQLLFTCDVVLEQWTAEPALKPDVSINILSPEDEGVDARHKERATSKAERDLKRLFRTLLKDGRRVRASGDARDVDVVVRAVEGVLNIVFGTGQGNHQES